MLKVLLSKVGTWFTILPNALLIFARNFIETIPPRDLTVTRIGVTEVRIRAYWKAYGRLPASLSDLPRLEGRDNATRDGWGRPIQYDVAEPSTVTLSCVCSAPANNDEAMRQNIIVTFDVSKEP